MFKNLNKTEKYLLAGIMVLAFFLIFFRLTRADLQGDDAHYAFRSIGYIDYMSSQLQTTPLQWFSGHMPWWTKLSFHDAPPLFFLVQHIFFKIFGVNDFVAKMPSALCAWALIGVVFLIGRELYSTKSGLAAALILTLSNYHIWLGRMGYLESLMLLLVSLSLLFLLKSKNKPRQILLAGFFLGLAMITKYTSFFLIPAFFIFALIYKKLFDKKFWLSLLIAGLIFSPVIFYNVMLYKTRGHADVQFSVLLGQATQSQTLNDWQILANRAGWSSHNFLLSLGSIVKNLGNMIGWPVFSAFLLGLVYFSWELILIRKSDYGKKHFFVLTLFIIIVLFFLIIGISGGHYLAAFNLIMAIILGQSLVSGYQLLKKEKNYLYFLEALIVLIACYQLIFIYNTNHHLLRPTKTWLYSNIRMENLGFQNISNYLAKKFRGKSSNIVLGFSQINRYNPLAEKNNIPKQYLDNSIYIFDDNTVWFSRLWYLERWRFYNFFNLVETRNLPQYFGDEFIKTIKNNASKQLYLADKQPIYFLKAKLNIQFDQPEYLGSCPDLLVKTIESDKNNITEDIKNRFNQTVFTVYKFTNLKTLINCF